MNVKEQEKLYWLNGKSLSLKDWAKIRGVKWQVLYRRIKVKKQSFQTAMSIGESSEASADY
jgi:hypothetical protein